MSNLEDDQIINQLQQSRDSVERALRLLILRALKEHCLTWDNLQSVVRRHFRSAHELTMMIDALIREDRIFRNEQGNYCLRQF